MAGLYLGTLLGGAILTETIFNRPGLGKLLYGAMLQRDYTMVQWCIVTFAAFVIVVNLLVDIAYAFIDPRVRYD